MNAQQTLDALRETDSTIENVDPTTLRTKPRIGATTAIYSVRQFADDQTPRVTIVTSPLPPDLAVRIAAVIAEYNKAAAAL